jgi:hypothetical protein
MYNIFMQFQVPQFIDTQDKVVGPLTLRQFMYVAAAGAMSAVLYFTVAIWLWFFLSIILIGGAIGIAFIKIEGRPFSRIILSAFDFYWKPQIYIWKSEEATTPAVQRTTEENGISLEKIITGAALHHKWEALQTGEKIPQEKIVQNKINVRYQVFQRMSGARDAAKRVDYR